MPPTPHPSTPPPDPTPSSDSDPPFSVNDIPLFFSLDSLPPSLALDPAEMRALAHLQTQVGIPVQIKYFDTLDSNRLQFPFSSWYNSFYNGEVLPRDLRRATSLRLRENFRSQEDFYVIAHNHHVSFLILSFWNHPPPLPLNDSSHTPFPDLTPFTSLHRLDLINLGLTRLSPPQFAPSYPVLQKMNLRSNFLSDLPDVFHASRFPALESINLGDNRIYTFPEPVLHLPCLKELVLTSNALTLLPECLSTLPHSLELHLGGNPLRSLSGFVNTGFNLHDSLQSLDLSPRGLALALLSVLLDLYSSNVLLDEPEFDYFAPLSELPPSRVPEFIESLEYKDYGLPFPKIADSRNPHATRFPPWFTHEFSSLLLHIDEFSRTSWQTYYRGHPAELARRYVRTLHDSSAPSLSPQERARLEYEADHHIYSYLLAQLPSDDSLLLTIRQRFSISLKSSKENEKNYSLYL